MQHITFEHWLPKIIGQKGMEMIGPYQGYKPQVDASISNVFATSALRFGHTLISPIMKRLNSNFTSIPEGDIPLHKSFFSPWRLVEEGGLDPIIRGLFASPAKMPMPNEGLNDDLTERLFEVAHTVALDLAALNIQRGRDHGLPSYTEWMEYCQLGSHQSWKSLGKYIKDEEKLKVLKDIYGHPDNVDVWVGSILEEKVEGGRVGPTTRCLLVEQFKRLRDGDRFWYENPSVFSAAQLTQVKQVTLSRIICDNADDIRRVPLNAFMNDDKESFLSCNRIPRMSFNPWTDCAEEEEVPISLTRIRRDAQSVSKKSDSKDDKRHRRNTRFMKKSSLLKVIKQLEERIAILEHKRGNSKSTPICIDFNGKIRMDNEVWNFSSESENKECVQCECKEQQIRCMLVQCNAD